jgi:prepilin-type N-terminal cleavage/methylation domain-containing protein
MSKLKQGFTLIESLVVMLVLASSMTAALYLLTTVVFSTQQNLKRTKAVYMAQECTELARNLRDTAWVNYRPWDCAFGGIDDEFVLSPTNSASNTISACNSMPGAIKLVPADAITATPNNRVISQEGNTLTHFPSAGSTNDTGYKRTLKHVDLDSNADTLDLECTVNWDFNGRDESVTAPLTLTNWRKN